MLVIDTVDVIDDPMNIEHEIHNCQAVIDSLAMDVLNTPLSHITAQDIVYGDQTAIGDLLEVFSGLMEFMLEEISSSASSNSAQILTAGIAFVMKPCIYEVALCIASYLSICLSSPKLSTNTLKITNIHIVFNF